MNRTRTVAIDKNDEVYSLQKLMYEYSKQLDSFSDPLIVKISQQLDEKLNYIQKTKMKN
ncbi:Spo0E family sporulation regulatory protein-aspartic acid phosphatase [Pseudalkalibacillus berkeleyi]|uniref:Aspartyl-phosphate phosphatase Spo0E family protein n=1 Tax=Pseudalkalibacillus berkeleyi TaxID=1069813 RepID=A0ABS9H1I8_9BACL|nr:Spo0E family sporulation regulatory protein-aspartic acid phosphatase [Pseudalkalibacillus berkeleyi]MCF6138859.1 aspartyl-phosphate phosphatase Spo0E family protein [Pseudalkalibacillus berkeleyi]